MSTLPASALAPSPPPDVTRAATALAPLLDHPVTPESTAEILRWMLRHNDLFALEIPTDPRQPNRYSHPILQRLRYQTRAAPWSEGCDLLELDEQYAIFCRQHGSGSPTFSTGATPPQPRYGPVDFVPATALYRAALLRHVITVLVNHREGARYDGVRGRIVYTETRLAKAPEYIWRYFREHPAGFRNAILQYRSLPLYQQLTADAYNDLAASQAEPFDLLSQRLKTDILAALADLDRTPFVRRPDLDRFCRRYTESALLKPTGQHQAHAVVFGHSGEAQTRTFDFLCVGPRETIRVGSSSPSSPRVTWHGMDDAMPLAQGEMVERLQAFTLPGYEVTYGILDLRPDTPKSDAQLQLVCNTGRYSILFDVERGTGRLPTPPDELRLDQARALDELNVVVSFALIPVLPSDRIARTWGQLTAQGFVPENVPSPVADLWGDFQREVARPNTGLVIPVYHVVDQERFRLGWNPARKLVLTRRQVPTSADAGIRKIRVVFYFPPPTSGGTEVLLQRAEFGTLFRHRLRSPAHEDTLCVMNMSCFSQYTVESWMAAFREAVRGQHQRDLDPMELPFLIGSRKGFDAEDFASLLQHPLKVIQGMCEGRTRSGLLAALAGNGKESYDPLSNLDRPELLELGGSFQLRVTHADYPDRTAGF